MNILENTLLSGIFLIFNLISLALYILSYLLKEYKTAFYAMLVQTGITLLYFFVSYISGSIFILTGSADFTANLIYFISLISALMNAIFGMKMYYHHRVVSAIIIQLGIFFSAILLITQISDTAYNYWLQEKTKKKFIDKQGFNQTQDFKQIKPVNKPDTNLSDSVN
jgi:hypothetical protein